MTTRSNPAAGILRAAVGRADAFECFGATVPAFLNSLAPLLAFPIAGALIGLFRDGPLVAVAVVLLALVVQLAPPVLSHVFAVYWRREAQWLRYATAYNWCQWALPLAAMVLVVLFGAAASAGLPQPLAARGVLVGLGAYSLWLNYFLARHGLELPRGKTALLVVLVNAITIGLAFLPSLIDQMLT